MFWPTNSTNPVILPSNHWRRRRTSRTFAAMMKRSWNAGSVACFAARARWCLSGWSIRKFVQGALFFLSFSFSMFGSVAVGIVVRYQSFTGHAGYWKSLKRIILEAVVYLNSSEGSKNHLLANTSRIDPARLLGWNVSCVSFIIDAFGDSLTTSMGHSLDCFFGFCASAVLCEVGGWNIVCSYCLLVQRGRGWEELHVETFSFDEPPWEFPLTLHFAGIAQHVIGVALLWCCRRKE